MNKIVLYDSFYGNTKLVAEEIGKQLGEEVPVINIKEYKYDDFDNIDLVVIGSPTRAFSPTKDIVQLIKNMKVLNKPIKVLCFDTRVVIKPEHPFLLRKLVKIFGYAIDTMEKRLRKNKNVKLLKSMAFYVDDSEGPLSPNELDKIVDFVSNIQ